MLRTNLNLLTGIKNLFDAKTHYVVCRTLYQQERLPFIQNAPNNNNANVGQNADLNKKHINNIPVADPSPQQVNKNESNVDQNSGLNEPPPNNVPLACPPPPQVNGNESNTDQSPQDLNEDQNEADPDQQSTSVPHCGFTNNFLTNTLKACNTDGNRKSYMDLTIRETRKRVIMESQHILASNVCPKYLEKDEMDYLKNNISLAKDVSIYLDAIKLFLIQDVMRINIKHVSNCDLSRPQIFEVSEGESQPLGGVIYGETSKNGFSRIRKVLIENEVCSKEDMPSIYQITKNRPKVESFEVTPESSPEAGVSYITTTEEE